MAKQFEALDDRLTGFIARQKVFFTASAAAGSRVNVSPREAAALRVIDPTTIVYLDKTGSGNETAAHLRADGRLTIMFCAFAGPPMILRLYGRGASLGWDTPDFAELVEQHYGGDAPLGARQIVRLDIDLVQTSCGFGVPLFDFQEDRPGLENWAQSKGPDGIRAYWAENGLTSMDGLPTGLSVE